MASCAIYRNFVVERDLFPNFMNDNIQTVYKGVLYTSMYTKRAISLKSERGLYVVVAHGFQYYLPVRVK